MGRDIYKIGGINVMMKLPRTTRRSGLVALAAITMLGALALSSTSALASTAIAKKSSNSAVTVSQPVSASVQAQTLAYWTQARRDAAQSVNVVAGAQVPSSQPAGGPNGPPHSEAGSSPAGVPSEPSEGSGVSSASQTTGPVPAAQPWSYPLPYDAFGVPTTSYKKYPYKVNGTIFFDNNGDGFKCSGTSIVNGHNTGEVDTAGHCVANTDSGNKFDEFAEFIPAYNGNGKTAAEIEPHGTFVATSYSTATEWLNNRNLEDDFGSMSVGKNGKKEKLSNAAGTAGWAYGFSDNEQYVEFGYPGESPYNGNTMEENWAASGPCSSGNLVCTGSPFTGGSSGGGWFIDWSPSSTGYLNGHTDFYYTSEPLTKYTPYYNSLWYEVHCFGKTGEC
jgi:hypothetical protein